MFSFLQNLFGGPAKVPLSELLSGNVPLVIAHRGASNEAPENTLPAFQRAASVGSHFVEMDFAETADGVPVILHDPTLDRTTNAVDVFAKNHNLLSEHTWAEVQTLDAGCRFTGKKKFIGVTLPSVEQAIASVLAHSTPLLERKAGDPQTIVDFLTKQNLLEQVVVESYDWDYLQALHDLEPRITLAALGSKDVTEDALERVAACGIKMLAWSHLALSRRVVNLLLERNLLLIAYTVDHRSRAGELIDWGVHGVITNEPAKMVKYFRGRA